VGTEAARKLAENAPQRSEHTKDLEKKKLLAEAPA